MGITIHFQGQLAKLGEIGAFIDEITDIAESMKWPYQVFDEDWSQPSTAELRHTERGVEIVGELGFKGVSLTVHPKCETLFLCFDREGILRDPISVATGMLKIPETDEEMPVSVKTQFATPEIHITIIKLLRYLKKRYIPDLRVTDEGKYWESEDPSVLRQKLSFLEEKLNEVGEALEAAEVGETSEYSPEEMLELVEKILQEKFDSRER